MKAKVQQFNNTLQSATAVTDNEIAVAFRIPETGIALGDVIDLDMNVLDQTQIAHNLSSGTDFETVISRHNVHDLRLPGGHGTSRFPSTERLRET